MKKIILIFLVINSINLNAQTYVYGGHIGGWIDDKAVDIDKISDGNILTTSANTSFGLKGLYKINDLGNIVWAFNEMTSTSQNFYSFLNTVTDEQDNIYSLLYINSTPNSTFIFNGKTYYSGVNLVKMNTNGNIIWVKKIGNLEQSGATVLFKNNNIYILGQFTGQININNQITLNSQQYFQCSTWINEQGNDFFIAKFDSIGNLINAISFGEDYDDFMVDATIDNDENIYFTGCSDFYFCAERYTHITKYSSSLNFIWKKELSKEVNGSQLIYPSNIFVSQNNKLYVWGYNLDIVSTINYTLNKPCYTNTNNWSPTANIIEFNKSNGAFQRNYQFTTCTSNGVFFVNGNYQTLDGNNGFMTDFDNDLLIYTSFRRPIVFSNNTYSPTYDTYTSQFNENLLLMRMKLSNFTPEFITKFDGQNQANGYISIDNPKGISIDSNNNLLLTGSFKENPLNILGNPISNNSGNNSTDVLYTKLNLNSLLSINENLSIQNNLIVYPNPTDNFLKVKYNDEIDEIKLYNIIGELILETKNFETPILNVESLIDGIYFIDFYFENKRIERKKFIKK